MASIVTDADRAEFQAMAEGEMDDLCWIRHETGRTVNSAGKSAPIYADIYGTEAAGAACQFDINVSANFNPTKSDAVGEQPIEVTQFRVKVPMSATGITSGHEVVCIASVDPELVGRVFPIAGPVGKTNGVARRFILKETS